MRFVTTPKYKPGQQTAAGAARQLHTSSQRISDVVYYYCHYHRRIFTWISFPSWFFPKRKTVWRGVLSHPGHGWRFSDGLSPQSSMVLGYGGVLGRWDLPFAGYGWGCCHTGSPRCSGEGKTTMVSLWGRNTLFYFKLEHRCQASGFTHGDDLK